MTEELIVELFIFCIFWFSSVPDNIIDFIFNILELDSKAFIKFVIPIVTILRSDDFNKLFEIFFDILIVSE